MGKTVFTKKQILEGLKQMEKQGKLISVVKNGETHWLDARTKEAKKIIRNRNPAR